MNRKNLITKAKSFFVECRRVLKITKKPSSTEFSTIVKVSGLGMLVIGVIGFLVHIIAIMVK